MITGIDHIDIAVKDVDSAVEVFKKMGFEFVQRTPHFNQVGGAVELKLPGEDQTIFEIHGITVGSHGNDELLSGVPGIRHIAFRVDSAQKTLDEIKAKGIRTSKDRDKVSHVKTSGRTLYNLVGSPDTEGWGTFYLQFAEKERTKPENP